MNKYTLIPEHLIQYSPLYMFKSELNKEKHGLNLGVKLGRQFPASSITDLRTNKDLKTASQMEIEVHLPKLNQTVTVEGNHVAVLLPRLTTLIYALNENGIEYELGKVLYTPSYLNQFRTDDTLSKENLEILKSSIDSLFDNEIMALSYNNRIRVVNRKTFIDFLIDLYIEYEDNLPFSVARALSKNATDFFEKSSNFIPMPSTRETLIVFGDGVRENNIITSEVCNMLQQIKYFLKGVKPLSNQELKKVSVRTSHIKKEIGQLGKTFDPDVFEFLATLEVQIGEEELRNLNYAMRVLIALNKGLDEVELSEGHTIFTRNLFLPYKFTPFKDRDVLHAYCGILSLTASKEPLVGLEVALDYLRSQLSEFIPRDKYGYAFIDAIIYYLNRKDETSIPFLRGGWNSEKPIDISVKFIEDAFSKSTVLKNDNKNKVYFLFYVLYNII